MAYSSGKYSYGICDKTGFRYATKDLVFEFRNGSKTGLRVGVDVVDPDQPQLQLGRLKVDDPKALRNPRPDRGLDQSRILASFNPVGQVGLDCSGHVGVVTVITS